MMGRRIAVVLVNGSGSQERYRFLRDFVSPFKAALDATSVKASLYVDKRELHRHGHRTEGASDLDRFPGEQNLFCPVSIAIREPEAEIGFYEAHWGDPAMTSTRWQKIKANFWLLTTFWNAIFRAGRYPRGSRLGILCRIGILMPLDILAFHLGECALVLLSILARRTAAVQGFGKLIYGYANDVKAYFSQAEIFHNQTRRDAIHARFDEVMIKASLESSDVYIVAHSFGSVIAYDCLHRHDVAPSKMSEDFLAWLAAREEKRAPVDYFEKLRGLITLGSPLDKAYLFFPWQRPSQPLAPFSVERESCGDRHRWVAVPRGEIASAAFSWRNFSDISDPVGGSIGFHRNESGFPEPSNTQFASAWLPGTAHNDLLRRQDLMQWIAATLLCKAAPPEPRGADLPDKVIHVLWSAALSAANVAALTILVFFLLDLLAGTLRDLVMDAESNTVFAQLDWLAGTLNAWRAGADVSGHGSWHLLRNGAVTGFLLLAKMLLLSLPFSYYYYRKSIRNQPWR